ncbi:hypothetical protein NDN08_002405 [Rhodosorus marinus]|uniref:Zinc finger protein 830 n=1 Tax=Rhodosorus marinus TaxID=101924 RepID=A0AAV8UXV4_9RHOD|nr:hypothetical protein NDN08_002405 [Rhodosorus marinus]
MEKLGDRHTKLKDLMRKRKLERRKGQVSSVPDQRRSHQPSSAQKEVIAEREVVEKATGLGGLAGYGGGDSDGSDEDSHSSSSEKSQGERLPSNFFDQSRTSGATKEVETVNKEERPAELEGFEDQLAQLEDEVQKEVEEIEEEKHEVEFDELELEDMHREDEQDEIQKKVQSFRERVVEVTRKRSRDRMIKSGVPEQVPVTKRISDNRAAGAAESEDDDGDDIDFDLDWRSKGL